MESDGDDVNKGLFHIEYFSSLLSVIGGERDTI